MEIILKPNEKQMETLAEVSKITGVDYDGLQWDQDITPNSLLEALADMVYEYHNLEEEFSEAKEHCLEYHTEKSVDHYEEYGISEKEFH